MALARRHTYETMITLCDAVRADNPPGLRALGLSALARK